jgi:hypothetical protein
VDIRAAYFFSQYRHQTDDDLLTVPLGQGIIPLNDPLTEGMKMLIAPVQFF